MEDHRYVVLLDAYQKPSDSQYRITLSALSRAEIDERLRESSVADDTTEPLPKMRWSARWQDEVNMTDRDTGDPRPGGIYLLVRR